jgi:hypothetical protein
VLDTFRRLSRRYAGSRFEQLYTGWREAKTAPRTDSQIVFSTFVLPHSYSFLGTFLGTVAEGGGE